MPQRSYEVQPEAPVTSSVILDGTVIIQMLKPAAAAAVAAKNMAADLHSLHILTASQCITYGPVG